MTPMEWQDIETAPKDGTRVDLWANGRRHTDYRWCRAMRHWRHPFKSMMWLGENVPTHWMPLPEPPK